MAARRFSLRSRFDVLLGPVAEGERVLLDGAQGGARQLDLGDARGQPVHQRGIQLSAAREALQVVRQLEDVVERNDALRFENADHLLHHLGVGFDVAGVGRAGQQVDHAVLRRAPCRLRTGGRQQQR